MLAKEFDVDRSCISRLLKRNNIELQEISHNRKKYTVDETYFEEINTEEKAYFLGLLYSDGCNQVKSNTVTINLQEQDKYILDKFVEAIKSDRPPILQKTIQYSKKAKIKNPNQPNATQNQYKVFVHNEIFSKNLEKIGMCSRKSLILNFPNENIVPKHLIPHFIRGYWDGDGSIGIYKDINNHRFMCSVVATENFCNTLSEILLSNFNIKPRIYKNTRLNYESTTRYLYLPNKKDIVTFLQWIYTDATIFLVRKFKKSQQIISTYQYEKENNMLKSIKNI